MCKILSTKKERMGREHFKVPHPDPTLLESFSSLIVPIQHFMTLDMSLPLLPLPFELVSCQLQVFTGRPEGRADASNVSDACFR